jgi:1,4-alpha-glucan branching enzyme/maltooligosyltrehalose trehalohydrolase
MAIILLAPSPPLLFMGEEFGAGTPFLFFCDFEKDLAVAVTEGRRNEFARFARFNDPAQRERIPDPNAVSTFDDSQLNWDVIEQSCHQDWLRFYRNLLRLRCQHIVPRLLTGCVVDADYELHGDRGITVHWNFPRPAEELILMTNLGNHSLSVSLPSASTVIYAAEEVSVGVIMQGILPPWSAAWLLKP